MIYLKFNKKAFEFHAEKVQNIFDEILRKKHIRRGKPLLDIYLNTDFLDFLKNNTSNLISGKPTKLLEINNEYEKLTLNDLEKTNIKSFFLQTGYEGFQEKYSKEFLDLIGVDTCVYCNRNYTINITKNHSRAELDHWFPKTQFPLLSLSFYNLIPSCHSCNHIKGNPKIDWEKALKEYIHPYFKENKEGFSFDFFYNKSLDKLNIETKSFKKSTKTDETLIFNKTKDIYNSHSEKELRDLVNLRYKYSKNYIKILSEDTFKNLKISKDEIYRTIFGIEINENDFHKRPFSKFKKDIIDKLLRIDKNLFD